MPDRIWTIPNAISFARLLGIPAIVYFGLIHHNDAAAFSIFVVAGITDWLDGFLARKLQQFSKLGQALDPIADRLYIVTAVIVLLMRGLIPWPVVAIIAARDVMMMLHLYRARRAGYAPPGVHYIGKAATMMLLYSVPLVFLGASTSFVADVARWTGLAFLVWGACVYWYAGWLYIAQFRRLEHA